MRRLALTPQWLGGLLLCLAAGTVCGFLGHWQWDVAQHGTLQNTAYAFNWWLFAVLFVGFWFKALHDTAVRNRALAAGEPSATAVAAARPTSRTREPAPVVPIEVPAADEDPEVAEWNAWLADMNANPQR